MKILKFILYFIFISLLGVGFWQVNKKFNIIDKIKELNKPKEIKEEVKPKDLVKDIGSDNYFKESKTGMEFIWISKGCFYMGSPADEEFRNDDEGPIHQVCVDGFWMSKYEVKKSEFKKFIEASGYMTDAEKQGFSLIYAGQWEKRKGYSWRKPGYEQEDNHPVVNVSWNDCMDMAKWMSSFTRKFRLPTEREWEYACRGGTQTSRFWGNDMQNACLFVNAADITAKKNFPAWEVMDCDDSYLYTAPCGVFKPNGFGLYDMLGNVWEWCLDEYKRDRYNIKLPALPVYKKDARVVIRGGSWYSRPSFIRCASRENIKYTDKRSYDVGFRLIAEN
ncbi:MAG: formylglycine-generating enzyme family protein [Desulfobacterales bacterium]|nr:formylglycine-generating enzyme family protein [Desulfobacterales bacterium]